MARVLAIVLTCFVAAAALAGRGRPSSTVARLQAPPGESGEPRSWAHVGLDGTPTIFAPAEPGSCLRVPAEDAASYRLCWTDNPTLCSDPAAPGSGVACSSVTDP